MFHIDAFIFCLLMGSLCSFLIKNFYYRAQRWGKNVAYKKKLAGGTLIADSEALFWYEKIKDPAYRPIWRWHYDFKPNEKKRHTLARKVGYLNAVIAVAVVLVYFLMSLNIQLVPNVPTATKTTVLAASLNLNLQYQNDAVGWIFHLANTTDSQHYGTLYPGNYTLMYMDIKRTDPAYDTRNILLNLKSANFTYYVNGTARIKNYIDNATWFIQSQDDSGNVAEYFIENGDANNSFFGWPTTIQGRSTLHIAVFIALGPFPIGGYTTLYSMTVTGGDTGSTVFVKGGYANYRGYTG